MNIKLLLSIYWLLNRWALSLSDVRLSSVGGCRKETDGRKEIRERLHWFPFECDKLNSSIGSFPCFFLIISTFMYNKMYITLC